MRLKDVMPLALGDPDFRTPKPIVDAAKEAMNEGYTHYTASEGLPELRRAIADKLENENRVSVNPDSEVVVTAGGEEALHATMQSLINVGDEVIVPDPCYAFDKLVQLAGGVPIFTPLKEEDEFRMNAKDIEEKITRRTKMIIMNSPNNPTGSVLSKDDVEQIAEIAKRHDLLVISDEIYEKIMFDNHRHYSIASFPGMKTRTITINGFSKGFAMTGWRIGYLAADKSLANVIKKVHHYIALSAPTIAQKAALFALSEKHIVDKSVKEMVKEYQKRRDLLVGQLNDMPGIHCLKPAGSIYAFPSVKGLGLSSFDFALHLIEECRVVVYPGTAFGNSGEGYLRVSLAYPKEKMGIALQKIKEVVQNLAAGARARNMKHCTTRRNVKNRNERKP